MTDIRTEIVTQLDTTLRASRRRDFLKLIAIGGMGVFLPGIATGCSDGVSPDPYMHAAFTMDRPVGPLNIVYAYAQFMRDFYARIYEGTRYFPGITTVEISALYFLKRAKDVQAEGLIRLIPKGRVVDTLLFDFQTIAFGERTSVMGAAQTFEDLGVATANGVMASITNPTDLVLVSKIASVWARHATMIHDMNWVAGLTQDRAGFAADDIVDPATGLDRSMDPTAFVAAAQPYFITELSVR